MSNSVITYDYCLLNSNLMTQVCYEAPININLINILALLAVVSFFFLIISKFQKENIFSLVSNLNFVQIADLFNLIPLLVVFNFFLLINYNFSINVSYINSLVVALFMYLVPVFLVPMLYFFIFSTGTLMCIGLTQKKSVIGNAVNDYITLVSFLLRFFSQFIRIILITLVFILLYEFINTTINLYLLNLLNSSNSKISTMLVSLVRIMFEVIDCFFIFVIQFNAFFIILL